MNAIFSMLNSLLDYLELRNLACPLLACPLGSKPNYALFICFVPFEYLFQQEIGLVGWDDGFLFNLQKKKKKKSSSFSLFLICEDLKCINLV